MALLEVSDLTVTLQTAGAGVNLVDGISFDIERGQTLCIVGESGSGKTVTAQTVMRLLEYVAPVETVGRVSFDGLDLTTSSQLEMASLRGLRIGMVFQECMEALNPTKRVGAQLEEVWRYHHGQRSRAGAETVRQRAVRLLADVEMPDPEGCLGKYPHQLSGGMQQRAMIAMALMCDPELLIADEPTTALDVTIQAEILRKLQGLQHQRGMASLLITHDMGIAAQVADRVGVMYAGRMVELGPVAGILEAPRHPYTAGLLACVPRPGEGQASRLPTIAGNVPGPGYRPPGCRFASRCDRATDQCRSQEPSFGPSNGPHGHAVACWHPLPAPAVRAGAASQAGRENGPSPAAEQGPATGPAGPADAPAAAPLVDLVDVTKVYAKRARARLGARSMADLDQHQGVVAVDRLSLQLHRGEFFALVGETGSGKSTLGRLIGNLEDATSGEITVTGTRLRKGRGRRTDKSFRRRVQMIFQDPYGSMDPRYPAGRVVAEPLRAILGLDRRAARKRAAELLGSVGLEPSTSGKRADELSGGQRQRVAIARAMAVRPELIVADEPTSALDVSVQGQVMNVLLGLQRELGLTYLFISHNLSLVLSVADRVGVMYLGALVEVAPAGRLAHEPAHPYSEALLRANPDPSAPGSDAGEPGASIGEPGLTSGPGARGGCRFRDRCPSRQAHCASASPALRPVAPGHLVACHFPLGSYPHSAPHDAADGGTRPGNDASHSTIVQEVAHVIRETPGRPT
jgi:peptide/nickel transport system ATP-binding protein